MFNKHLLKSVSRLLNLIAAPPNLRAQQQPGDRSGPFTHWFDGGAYGVVAGYTVFEFNDGARALIMASSNQLLIDLPAGEHVSLSLGKIEPEGLPQAVAGLAESGTAAPSSTLPAAPPGTVPEPTVPAPASDQLTSPAAPVTASSPAPIETIPPVTARHCPQCGADNKVTARFCRQCGKSLIGGAE